jgi:hypothetical protein
MEIILFLVAAVIIMVAIFAGLSAQSPLFIFVVVASMVGGVLSPLWHLLYGIVYNPGLYFLVGDTLPLAAILGGWLMVLPSLIIFATMRRMFVQMGYLGTWGIVGVFVAYFWIFESLGVYWQIWSYDNEITAIGVPTSLLMALLHTLFAVVLLRVLYEYWRVSATSTLPVIPIVLGLQALCYGIIGAPFYAMSMLTGTSVLTALGLLCTIAVVAWGIHITITTLLSIQPNTGATGSLYVADIAVLEELARHQKD